jgi:S-adenosylmethionine synthetase
MEEVVMAKLFHKAMAVGLLCGMLMQSVFAEEATLRWFTSESVCAGHPDKMCDQISDAILDAILAKDPKAKVGVETVVGANCIGLFGEVNTTADVDFAAIAREKVKELGYTIPEWGFSDQSPVLVYIHKQSPEINMGVQDDQGAGDQGMMFGYACDETAELMPLPIVLAHALTRQLDDVRKNHVLDFIRPDGKSQVTVAYEKDRPVRVETVVIATPHAETVDPATVKEAVIREVVQPVLQRYGYSIDSSHVIVNGTGLWHIPGPESDAGLTGRKIIVDTYGGYARIGGGAFSGKDPSKVDRSGAYAARFIAKNIVAAGLARRCEVGLAYVIGHARPVMQQIDTFGTATASQEEIQAFVNRLIDTSVKGIIQALDLRRPMYQSTAAYGHFGREENFPWEKVVVERKLMQTASTSISSQ